MSSSTRGGGRSVFFATLPLLLLWFSCCPSSFSSQSISNVTVIGSVFCDICSNNSFTKHSYFLQGARVQVQCSFKASATAKEEIVITTERTTDRFGIYRVDIPPVDGFECREGHVIDSFCRANLVGSSSPMCNVPGMSTSAEHLAIRFSQANLCIYNLNALNFRPGKKDATLCQQNRMAATMTAAPEGMVVKGEELNSSLFFWPPFWRPPHWPFPYWSPPSFPFPFHSPPSIPLPPWLAPSPPSIPLPPWLAPSPPSFPLPPWLAPSPPAFHFPLPFTSPPPSGFQFPPFPFASPPPPAFHIPFPFLSPPPPPPPSFPFIPHIPFLSSPPPPPPPSFPFTFPPNPFTPSPPTPSPPPPSFPFTFPPNPFTPSPPPPSPPPPSFPFTFPPFSNPFTPSPPPPSPPPPSPPPPSFSFPFPHFPPLNPSPSPPPPSPPPPQAPQFSWSDPRTWFHPPAAPPNPDEHP